MGKAPTFGYSDVRPIKEQRESLPVFKLRDQLIQAVNDHQVSCPCLLAKRVANSRGLLWVHAVPKTPHVLKGQTQLVVQHLSWIAILSAVCLRLSHLARRVMY